jgi:hypothetical protein
LPTYLLETVPVLLVGRELGEQLQILEVVEALEHRTQQQLYTQRGKRLGTTATTKLQAAQPRKLEKTRQCKEDWRID